MIGIYKITNPNGKIYIGQSIHIERRWKEYRKYQRCDKQIKLYNSLNHYGVENHKFEIIEECDISLLNEREIYWGEVYNALHPKGLCLKLGNANGKVSEETKQKISKANKGITGKYIRTNYIKIKTSKANSIDIFQFSKEGVLIQEWKSIVSAENQFGKGIKEVLKGKIKSAHGFVWSYDNIFHGFNIDHGNRKIVNQYNLEGNFIKEWKSTIEIQNQLGFANSNISACCNNKQKTAYGFKWKYK